MRGKIVVVGSALLTRIMPMAIGFLVATLFGSRRYAEAVLLITASNLSGSLPMLAVTPQVLRTADTAAAVALAIRGLVVGMLIIVATTILVSRHLGIPDSTVFLLSYSSAVFVFGVSQALLNQQMRNLTALCHAGAVSAFSLLMATLSYRIAPRSDVFLDVLGITMLAAAAVSFLSIWIRDARVAREPGRRSFDRGATQNALLAGLFSLLVMTGLFLSGLRTKGLGDADGFVAFSLGLQVFSVVVFVPGALSSYFVPRLARTGESSVPDMMATALRSYLVIGVPVALAALAASPLLFGYLHLPMNANTLATYGLVQLAAVLAALNAAYNQVLTSLGRFATLAGLSLIWLVVLLCSQALLPARPLSTSLTLCIAYAVLLFASRFACGRRIAFRQSLVP